MSNVALEAEGLHTFYGKSHILHGVGLEVREGEIVALLGRNGAGKTTTLRSLMGLTHAREGAVRIFGRASMTCCRDAVAGRLGHPQKAIACLNQLDPALRLSNLKDLVPLRRSKISPGWQTACEKQDFQSDW